MVADSSKDGLRANWKSVVACMVMAMFPFQYGFDFGLIGGLQAMIGFLKIFGHRNPHVAIGWNISPGRQQLISSLMTLGAFLSSLAVGPIATYIGRKTSLWIAILLCLASNALMMATTSIGGLYAGRLIIGLANGMFMTFSQLYLQECAPARYRGLVISVLNIWVAVGATVGTIVDNFTSTLLTRGSYLIPLGLVFVLPCVLSVAMLFIPESPRWLMQAGRTEDARKALRWLRPSEELAQEEYLEIEATMEQERALSQGVAMKDMFSNPIDRRRTLLAVGAVTVQAASGAMFIIAYGTYFFEMANIGRPFENAVILQSVGVIAMIINSFVITRFGRRRVFMVTGLFICGLTMLIIAVVYTKHPGTTSTGQVIVGLTVVYGLAYNGMIATYAWVSGGELPSQRLRSYTFGLAAAIGFLGAWITTFTAPYFINPESLGWSAKYGYIWCPSAWIAAVWVYFFLPEAKDRTLEEIDEMFEACLPARKFRRYQCQGRADAVTEKFDSKDCEVTQMEDVRV